MEYPDNDANSSVSNLMSARFDGTEIAYSCDEDTALPSIIRVKVLSYFLS